ncbi:serine carboxypeptidase-like 46 isoform X2 [Syzygium oleosum]|uniref:serine carboxypeptidase-like 46 isoform X2 n=1 Tax=Syzygium oleosum TaxID=219896 RepID=UPI0011D23151|nr:serine carboxypeptidase-like 46 isoform X2 [Syzygium oleosum]
MLLSASLTRVPSSMYMMLWYFIVIVNGVIPLFSSCTSTAELIDELPGQPDGVSFEQHSGYIVTDSWRGHALFYYLVEADARNPLSYPLTLWFNGGPGCSSLGFGAFMEHGPFRPAGDGGLMKNEFSWNKVSNMLYVESPIGVGFSYSNTTLDYVDWGDADTARDNMQFLLSWFEEYPKYRDSDLFLAGESYAGHYVPQLAALVLDYNKQSHGKPINLRAIALGNPLLDSQISVDGATFLWSHGVISDETLKLKETVCNDSRYLMELIHHKISTECTEVFEKQVEEMGNFTDPGDVLEPYCFSGTAAMQSASSSAWDAYHAKLARRMVLTDPCLGDSIFSYLNNPRVQKALHANTTKLPLAWQFCSGSLSYHAVELGTNIIPLLSALIKEHLRVLLFSGDQDSKIPLTQTRMIANMIARDLKFTSLGQYAPWYDKMQVGGWTQSFGTSRKGKNATHLTFATVRGAAHEVPYTSPSQALTLFKAFLEGSSLPKVPFKN